MGSQMVVRCPAYRDYSPDGAREKGLSALPVTGPTSDHVGMGIDLPTAIVAGLALAVAAAFAAFAGRLSARLFFDTSPDEPRDHH